MAGQIITQHLSLLAILFFAYFIRGITGFGSGLIAVPSLALIYPLPLVVPLVLSLDFAASFMLARSDKKLADWSEIRALLPFGVIGALAGTSLLIHAQASILLLALGILALLVGVCDLMGMMPQQRIHRYWSAPAGLVGGCAGALFGTSGPAYILYLSRRLRDKSALRASFSWLFLIDGSFRLSLFVLTGLLFKAKTLQAILLGIIPMLIGLKLGQRTHLQLPQKHSHRLLGCLLLISGVSLLFKYFH